MDREFLSECLEAGMSLGEIAALVDRDPSTIGYWVNKHGLRANGNARYAARGGLTKEQLEPLVRQGLTYREIAARVDRSVSTVRYWMTEHGLANPRRFGREEIERAVAEGRRTVVRDCRRHGETEYALVGSERRPRCKKCRAEAVARRRRRVKEILVQEAGGKCELCGYSRSLCALEFHHRDPSQKAFGIAYRGITRGIDEVRREVQKCVLLCANCHAEVEGGVASLT
jgi:transposase